MVIDASPQNLKEWQRLTRLHREADFYVGAWETLVPYLAQLGDTLVQGHRYEKVIADDMIIDIRASQVIPSTSQLGISPSLDIIQLPFSLPLLIQSLDLVHSGTPVVVMHSMIPPPLYDILHILQALLPGLITLDQRGLPDAKWLDRNEDMLREVFGCTYFRILRTAAVALSAR